MTSIHDNPERGAMILRAIGECVALNEPPTIGNVSDKLEKFPEFDLLDSELEEALREMKATPEPTPAPAPEPTPAPAADDGDMIEISREQMHKLCEKAQARLDAARIVVKVLQGNVVETKRKLADAITAWQQQADPLTPAQRREREMRNHLASEQDKRAKRGGVQPNAAAYVAKRMTNSGNHRGAFPRQYMGRNIRSI